MIESLQKLISLVRSMITWWFFVEPWETAIRVRAGKHVLTCGPGVHLRVPLIDTIYVHNTRRHVHQVPPTTLSSRDGKVFTVMSSISLSIRDAALLHSTVQDPYNVINQLMWQVTSEYVGAQDSKDLSAAGLKAALDTIDLGRFGLGDADTCVSNFAHVRTYRLISDGMQTWTDDACRLSTTTRKP